VNDGYGPYPAEPQTNPAGAAGASTRVVRGGSFFDGSGSVRASYRLGLEPLNFVPSVGFRVVRTP
jgi:formylglycine-generating enzyme required for sulfatase activity